MGSSLAASLYALMACLQEARKISVHPLVLERPTISPIGFTPVEDGSSHACSRAMALAAPLTSQGEGGGAQGKRAQVTVVLFVSRRWAPPGIGVLGVSHW